jgi:hypothetical protein
LNIATTVDAMENEEKRIATNPATRAILSRPGKERKVTDALKRIAAFHDGYETEEWYSHKERYTHNETGAGADHEHGSRVV